MLLVALGLFLLACLIGAVFSVNALIQTFRFGLPYVSSPRWAVEWLMDNVELQDYDIVYELGCGDARVLAGLATKFPNTKFIGLEIQWWPHLLAKRLTRKKPNVAILRQNFLKSDLSDATVMYGFFIPTMSPAVIEYLIKQLDRGVTMILLGFALPGRTAVQEVSAPNGRGGKIRVYNTRNASSTSPRTS